MGIYVFSTFHVLSIGKSLSEAFILISTNPQYEKIDLPVQYMKTTSSEHVLKKKKGCQALLINIS